MTDREFEQCMSAMAAGDRDSLRHIYDAYLKLIYAVCVRHHRTARGG